MPKEIKESIINEIRADRKAGLTIQEICERHGVSDFTVKKYCKGIKSGSKKRSTTITPERKTEQRVSNILAQEIVEIAENELRKRLDAGRMTIEELGRVAESYGMEPAQYVRWLQDQFLAKGEQVSTWEEIKDFGMGCILARAAGVKIDPRIIPLMHILTKLEE